MFSVLICNDKKGEDNLKLVPNLSCSKAGVFRHAESESSLYFVLSWFLKEVLVIPCWNPQQLFRVSETHHDFGQH